MYANNTFYNMLLRIESVYCNLPKEKNVALFGVGMIGNIGYTLEAFRSEIVFKH